MSRGNDVPQTVKQAEDYGWSWLTVVCLSCRHRNQLKFADLTQQRGSATRLGALAAKFYCGKCRGRRLEFELGAYMNRRRSTLAGPAADRFQRRDSHPRAARLAGARSSFEIVQWQTL